MTTLLYLHGVGDDGTRRDWWEQLQEDSGLDLSGMDVIAPDYMTLLTAPLSSLGAQPPLARTTSDHLGEGPRRAYRARQTATNTHLRESGSSSVWPYRRRGFARVPGVLDAIGEKLVMGVIFEEVGMYNKEEQRRRSILHAVIEQLPASGPVVILGHSLGALVALDLIMHLPDAIEVPLLVTAASALARRELPPDVAELPSRFPYDRVGGWINVFSPRDAVTRGLPIGMRFPQSIDVTVHGGIGDHNLTTCLADPGIADVLAHCLTTSETSRPGVPVPAPHASRPMLSRQQAMELATMQIAFHMEQLIAENPATSPEVMAQFLEARRQAGERAALRMGSDEAEPETGHHHAWDTDHAPALWHLVAERDVPALLVRIAGADPFAPSVVHIPRDISDEARHRVAADVGLPPGWVDVAARSLREAAALFRMPRRRRRAQQNELEALPQPDSETASHITDVVRQSLVPVAAADSVRLSRLTSGLGDIRPVCIELLARAMTAQRLGIPAAGSEERTVLSRLMVLLGDYRARVSSESGHHERLLAELRRRTATVGQSLSWLADRNIGIAPVR